MKLVPDLVPMQHHAVSTGGCSLVIPTSWPLPIIMVIVCNFASSEISPSLSCLLSQSLLLVLQSIYLKSLLSPWLLSLKLLYPLSSPLSLTSLTSSLSMSSKPLPWFCCFLQFCLHPCLKLCPPFCHHCLVFFSPLSLAFILVLIPSSILVS